MNKEINIAYLFDIAKQFRTAIESYQPEEYPPYVSMRYGFPRGSCGEASDLLGIYLLKKGFKNVTYVCGKRKGGSHAWLDVDGIIIDITANQFEDEIAESVIVTKGSKWHEQSWKIGSVRGMISFNSEKGLIGADKMVAYNMIVKRMDENCR